MAVFRLSNKRLVSLLFLSAIGLISGLFAGLVRLGYLSNSEFSISGFLHGPLMINGFLGTLISLERAAALEKKWALLAPSLIGISIFFILFGFNQFGALLFLSGSLMLLATLFYIYNLQPAAHHLIMAAGGFSLVIGNILFLFQNPVYLLVVWWMGFPLLTIFGERLELNRIMRPPKNAVYLFSFFIVLWFFGAVFMHENQVYGWHLVCVSIIASAVWLSKYDIARKTIKAFQWTKFSAWSLLSGYAWLIFAGISGLWFGFMTAGPIYDAILHSIFIGFVFSMIFAHAAVIIPSLSGVLVPYSPYFYIPLIFLHVFLILRVIGDFIGSYSIRAIGSWGNVAAILLFLGGILFQLIKEKRQ